MYIALTEIDNNQLISVVDTNQDNFMNKVVKALEEHFDASVILDNNNTLDLTQLARGRTLELSVNIDDFKSKIGVEQTWLY